MLEPGTCKSCGASILWAVTLLGRPIPLDAKPEKRLVALPDQPSRVSLKDTYMSHFATCPQAGEHRRPRSRGAS